MKMEFKGLDKNSLIEWPGNIVSVAYTGGCNFRCPYCQNEELVLGPDSLPTIEGREVLDHLRSREKWLDGLIVTGGEPTLHSSILDFARKVKDEGLKFGVETNGSNPEVLRELIQKDLVDHISFDFKAPLVWGKYKEVIGADDKKLFEKIKESLELVKNSDISKIFRTTIVPTLLDKEDIMEIAEELEGEEFHLQQFSPEKTLDKEYEEIDPYSEEKLEQIKKQVQQESNVKECKIRNL